MLTRFHANMFTSTLLAYPRVARKLLASGTPVISVWHASY